MKTSNARGPIRALWYAFRVRNFVRVLSISGNDRSRETERGSSSDQRFEVLGERKKTGDVSASIGCLCGGSCEFDAAEDGQVEILHFISDGPFIFMRKDVRGKNCCIVSSTTTKHTPPALWRSFK